MVNISDYFFARRHNYFKNRCKDSTPECRIAAEAERKCNFLTSGCRQKAFSLTPFGNNHKHLKTPRV